MEREITDDCQHETFFFHWRNWGDTYLLVHLDGNCGHSGVISILRMTQMRTIFPTNKGQSTQSTVRYCEVATSASANKMSHDWKLFQKVKKVDLLCWCALFWKLLRCTNATFFMSFCCMLIAWLKASKQSSERDSLKQREQGKSTNRRRWRGGEGWFMVRRTKAVHSRLPGPGWGGDSASWRIEMCHNWVCRYPVWVGSKSTF